MQPARRAAPSPGALDDAAAKRPRKACSYGENCYRRNPAHLREYNHPHLETILDNYSGAGDYPIPENLLIQRQMIEEQLNIILDKNIYAFGNALKQNDAIAKKDPSSSDDDTNISLNNQPNSEVSFKNSQSKDSTNIAGSSEDKNNVATANTIVNNNNTVQRNSQNAASSSRDSVSATTAKNVLNEIKGDYNVKDNKNASKMDTKNSDYRPIVEPTRRELDFFKVVLPKGRMAEKHRRNAPYHIFYTTITDSRETHTQGNSVTFQELLDRSLGELKTSLQINFMVDIGWLLAQYYFAGYSNKRLTVLYGEDMPDLRTVGQRNRNVDAHLVGMATPFGKHHTKLMLLCYEDGSLRVVVSTANLYIDDWENRTQGPYDFRSTATRRLWMSPACPALPPAAMPHHGESPTGFKRALLAYLDHYRLPSLAPHIERVKRCDFSAVNVFLVASVPGGHTDCAWGMSRVGALLSQHCRVPPAERHRWDLVAQASSIGSYGGQPKLWLTGDFLTKFCRVQNESALLSSTPARLRLIYPSLDNVKRSHDGLLGGGCLPYAAAAHSKQPWLIDFLHQWKAERSGRERAMPHIKSYLRASPDYKVAAYYLLTSANISKAAWGTINKGNGALRIMSYEAGVLFLPSLVINRDFFPLDPTDSEHLPVPYDLPPTPYTGAMVPWVMDYLDR